MRETKMKPILGCFLALAATVFIFEAREAGAGNPISCNYLFGNGKGAKGDLKFDLDSSAKPKVDFGTQCQNTAAHFNDTLKKAQQACVNSMLIWEQDQSQRQGGDLPSDVAGCPCPQCQLAMNELSTMVADGTNVNGYLSAVNNGGIYSLASHDVELDLDAQIAALKKTADTAAKNAIYSGDQCKGFQAHVEAAVAELSAAKARLISLRARIAVPKGADLSKAGNYWRNVDAQYGRAAMTDTQANAYAAKLMASNDPMEKQVGNMIQVAQNLDNPSQRDVANQLQQAIIVCQSDTNYPLQNDGVVAKRTISRIRSLMEKNPSAFAKCLKDQGAQGIPKLAPVGARAVDLESGAQDQEAMAKHEADLDTSPAALKAKYDIPANYVRLPGNGLRDVSPDGQTITCVAHCIGFSEHVVHPFTQNEIAKIGGHCPAAYYARSATERTWCASEPSQMAIDKAQCDDKPVLTTPTVAPAAAVQHAAAAPAVVSPTTPSPEKDLSTNLTTVKNIFGSNATGISKNKLYVFCNVTKDGSTKEVPFQVQDKITGPIFKCP